MIVRPDDFRMNDHGVYDHEGDMGIIGWRMAERVFDELLPLVDEVRALAGCPGAGKTTWVERHGIEGVLYLDAMLARRHTRRSVCEQAAAAGKQIGCVFLDVDLETCFARNKMRPSGRVVPEEYLRAAYRRLSVCPPDVDEGWRNVLRLGAGRDASMCP